MPRFDLVRPGIGAATFRLIASVLRGCAFKTKGVREFEFFISRPVFSLNPGFATTLGSNGPFVLVNYSSLS